VADVGDVLERADLGARIWVRGIGRSLYPLLRSGDTVRVERCVAGALRPGDIAVLRAMGGELVVHVVVSIAPLATASLLGDEDAPGLRVLGKVVAVRRARLVLPIPALARPALRMAQSATAALWANDSFRLGVRRLRGALTSPRTAAVRRRLVGELEVRTLAAGDRDAMLLFTGDHLRLSAPFLERQLRDRWTRVGAAAGAFGRGGRMYGFAFLDEYGQEDVHLDGFWVRSVYVAPMARGMGIGGALLEALAEAARRQGLDRIWADVLAENAPSRAMFVRHGFAEVGGDVAESARRALREKEPLVVLSRELG